MRQWRILLWCLALGAVSPSWAGMVGTVTEVAGEVRLLRGEYYFAAAIGVELAPDDIVETGRNARAQLEMADKSILRLGSETRLALAEYRLADDQSVVSASVELLSGWLRFAIAKLRNDGAYRIDTPTMAIGIRGTEGVIESAADESGLLLEEGVIEVAPPRSDFASAVIQRVQAGEFIQRAYGRPFQRPPAPPAAFRQRLPVSVERPVVQRIDAIKQRGIAPRQLRPVGEQDIKRYLQDHPHMRDRLHQRFDERLKGDPEFREKIRQRRERRRDAIDKLDGPARDRPVKRGFVPRAPGDHVLDPAPAPLAPRGKAPVAPIAQPLPGFAQPKQADPAPTLYPVPPTGTATKPVAPLDPRQKLPVPIGVAPAKSAPLPEGQVEKPGTQPADEAQTKEPLNQGAPAIKPYLSAPPPPPPPPPPPTRLPQIQLPLQLP